MSLSQFGSPKRACAAATALLIVFFALTAAPALAGMAYVANSGSGTVSVVDTTTNSLVGTIPVGGEPVSLAIAPDGTRVYVADRATGTVVAIDVAGNAVLGAPIPVGLKPAGIAITPDGSRVYVANSGSESVTVISTATNTVSGTAILVGKEPDGIAISPDGTRAYVAQRSGNVSIIDTSTNAVIGSVEDALGPAQIAIGPRGGRAFVTNGSSSSVTAFNPATGTVIGAPIVVGKEPRGIAIGPNGEFAYAASPLEGTVTPIDTALDLPLGAPIPFPGATGVAIRPDGREGFVTDGAGSFVSILDATRNVAAGTTAVGTAPTDVAVVPDQGPHASFWVSPTLRRARAKLTFHAGGSSDPDGTIAKYAWKFGDGSHAEGESPTRVHRYRRPGTYEVTLATTDNEGCSTQQIYTGRTASCNGSPAATVTIPLTVVDATGPAIQLGGARRQRLAGRVKLLARCPRDACSVSARGTVVTAIEAGGRIREHRYRLGTAVASLQPGAWGQLILRVPARTRLAARRILLRGGVANARLTAIASNSSGEKRVAQRTVKLFIPRPRKHH